MNRVGPGFGTEKYLALEQNEESGAGVAGLAGSGVAGIQNWVFSLIDYIGRSFKQGYKHLALGQDRESESIGAGSEALGGKDWTLLLPNDVLEHIFNFLDPESAARAFGVCPRWFDRSFNNLAKGSDDSKVLDRVFAIVEHLMWVEEGERALIDHKLGVVGDKFLGASNIRFAISETLIEKSKQKSIGRAIKIADRHGGISGFCEYLVGKGKLFQALRVVDKIPNKGRKYGVIEDICIKLMELKKADQLLAIMGMMPNQGVAVFLRISTKLLEKNDPDNAFEIIKLMPPGNAKSDALLAISNKFVELERLEDALVCAKSIGADVGKCKPRAYHKWQRSDALKSIANGYFDKKEFVRAKEIANMMPKFDERARLCLDMSKRLLERDDPDNAFEFVKLMPYKKKGQSDALLAISNKFIQLGRLEDALACAKAIGANGGNPRYREYHNWQKSNALKSIANGYFHKREFTRAKEIAEMIPIQEPSTEALRKNLLRIIDDQLLGIGNMEEALEFFNAIPEWFGAADIDEVLGGIDEMPGELFGAADIDEVLGGIDEMPDQLPEAEDEGMNGVLEFFNEI